MELSVDCARACFVDNFLMQCLAKLGITPLIWFLPTMVLRPLVVMAIPVLSLSAILPMVVIMLGTGDMLGVIWWHVDLPLHALLQCVGPSLTLHDSSADYCHATCVNLSLSACCSINKGNG